MTTTLRTVEQQAKIDKYLGSCETYTFDSADSSENDDVSTIAKAKQALAAVKAKAAAAALPSRSGSASKVSQSTSILRSKAAMSAKNAVASVYDDDDESSSSSEEEAAASSRSMERMSSRLKSSAVVSTKALSSSSGKVEVEKNKYAFSFTTAAKPKDKDKERIQAVVDEKLSDKHVVKLRNAIKASEPVVVRVNFSRSSRAQIHLKPLNADGSLYAVGTIYNGTSSSPVVAFGTLTASNGAIEAADGWVAKTMDAVDHDDEAARLIVQTTHTLCERACKN